MEVAQRRTRCDNYTHDEELLFLECIRKYMHILNIKLGNNVNNKKKDIAWKNITTDFNLLNNRERSYNQLKMKFNGLKTLSRKYAAEKLKSIPPKYNEVFEEFLILSNIKQETSSTTSDPLTIHSKNYSLDSLDSMQSDQVELFQIILQSPKPNQDNNNEDNTVENGWEDIEEVSEDIEDVSEDIEDVSEDIGDVSEDIGDVSEDINNGRQGVNNGRQGVNNGRQDINNGRQDINNGRQDINNRRQDINNGRQVINNGRQDSNNRRKGINNGRRDIGNGQKDISNGKKGINPGYKTIFNALKSDIFHTIREKKSRLLELEIQEKILKMNFDKELRKKQLELMDLEIELKRRRLENVDDGGSP